MQHPKAFPPFQPFADAGPSGIPLKLFSIKEQIMVALASAPFSSIPNVMEFLGESDLYNAFRELEEEGLIAGLDVVVSRRSIRRFVLARLGVQHVTRAFQHDGQVRAALPLTWQMTEDGVLKLLSWLPMIEALYDILASFWTGGLAEPFELRSEYPAPDCDSSLWLGIPALADLRWLTRGRLHLAATWRFYRPDRGGYRYITVPFFWSGLLPQEDFNDRSMRLGSPFVRSLRSPADYPWGGFPPIAVAVGLDEFSAWRARWAYGADVDVAAVDPAGGLVWSAGESDSEWTLEKTRPSARVIGYPERALLADGNEVLNFGGVREHRILHFIAQFRAATRANLVKAFKMSRGAVNDVMDLLTGRGLVEDVDGHLYLTQAGLHMLAARDRIDVGRLTEVKYEDPKGKEALRERRHDAAVAEAATHFLAKGLAAVAGWRWLVSWGEGKDEGQLNPDLWVRIPGPGRDIGIWVPVEVEFSATSRKRIEEEKLRSYRMSLADLGIGYPILAITGAKEPAKLFDDAAGDLTIFVTTLAEFKTDIWEGPNSVWRHKGKPVDMRAIAGGRRVHLCQRTGRKVDTSAPPVETWLEQHRRESVWVDPATEGLETCGWEDPPVFEVVDDHGPVDKSPAVPAAAVQSPPPANNPVTVPKRPAGLPAVYHADRRPAGPARLPPIPDEVIRPPLPWDLARQRNPRLSRINLALEYACAVALQQLQRDELDALERVCLKRLMAIVAYGLALHEKADDEKVKAIVSLCLRLEDEYRQWIESAGIWKVLTTPTSIVDPRSAFKELIKDFPTHGPGARKLFNSWYSEVGRAVKSARKARTLESAAGSDISAAS